jgi:hypothetical protein
MKSESGRKWKRNLSKVSCHFNLHGNNEDSGIRWSVLDHIVNVTVATCTSGGLQTPYGAGG